MCGTWRSLELQVSHTSPEHQKLSCCALPRLEIRRTQSELCGRMSPLCAGFRSSAMSQLTEAAGFFQRYRLKAANVTERQEHLNPKGKEKVEHIQAMLKSQMEEELLFQGFYQTKGVLVLSLHPENHNKLHGSGLFHGPSFPESGVSGVPPVCQSITCDPASFCSPGSCCVFILCWCIFADEYTAGVCT